MRKLEKPITIGKTGEVVTHIEFRNGFPVLDKWALPNQDVTIAITGNPDFDRIEARKAWKHTHGDVPQKVVFHHDGNFTELGKHKNHRIMAGRMQMLPGEFHRVLKHKGSASLARFHYLNEKVAREVNELARKGKGPLVALQRRLAQRVTRSLRIGRVVPIVGGLITLYFFAEDVEAHGLGGAVVRATPLLGDIVSAADLGRELAAEIRAAARRRIKDAEDRANLPVKAAQRDAAEATSAAFIEIARTLPVTKEYMRLEEIEQAVRDAIRGFTARSTQCIFTFIREPMEALRQSTSRGDFGPRDTRWSRSYNRGYRSPQNWIGRAL
ncbi:MAG: hypothetical protein DWQ37_22035 [Planctomycetota bacterium]|nr:MAG: hypothetical protein DWQ37_22035 [Planctomycetota bacterium]